MKAIGIIRTSTERQEIESQRKEVVDFIRRDGVKQSDIVIIGEAGASAIKLDEKYRENIEKVYRLIERGGVSCVYAFAIDRIGRNEVTLMEFKNFLIEHKVNLKIMNPTLTLLNPDGTINSGVELAFSLFATMSKQEMETKKARFKRAKERNRANGKFHGGAAVLFGYTVDENRFVVPDPVESENVRLIYELYATGRYSIKQIEQELKERGVKSRYDLIGPHIARYLKLKCYCGRDEKLRYPPIVPTELFDKVQEFLHANRINKSREHFHSYFGNKLIVCPDCGHYYVAHETSYKCHFHTQHKCPNCLCMSVAVVDGLLWHFSKQLELDAQLRMGKADADKLDCEIKVLEQKRQNLEAQAETTERKMANTKQLFMEAVITREEFDDAMARHRKSDEARQSRLLEVKSEIRRLSREAEIIRSGKGFWEDLGSLDFAIQSMRDEKKMSEIVHRHIKRVDVKYIGSKNLGFEAVLTSYAGFQMKAEYWPRLGKKLVINGIREKYESYAIDRSKLK